MIDLDREMPVNMPWSLVCRLAVQAHASGVSMADLMEQAVAGYVTRMERLEALQAYVAAHPELTLEDLADLAEAHGTRVSITLDRR